MSSHTKKTSEQRLPVIVRRKNVTESSHVHRKNLKQMRPLSAVDEFSSTTNRPTSPLYGTPLNDEDKKKKMESNACVDLTDHFDNVIIVDQILTHSFVGIYTSQEGFCDLCRSPVVSRKRQLIHVTEDLHSWNACDDCFMIEEH